MSRSVLRGVVVAVAAGVLVAGCGTVEAGSAATVGDRRISVQSLQDATTDIQALYGPNQPVPQKSVLFLLAIGPYLQTAAVKAGAGASLEQAREPFSGKVPHPSDAALKVIQASMALGNLQKLGAERGEPAIREAAEALIKAKLHVNPRYGTFDPAVEVDIQDAAQPNWLLKRAGAPSSPAQSPSDAPPAP